MLPQVGGDERRADGGNRPVGFMIHLEKQNVHSLFLSRTNTAVTG
jgi:hypothetical protein